MQLQAPPHEKRAEEKRSPFLWLSKNGGVTATTTVFEPTLLFKLLFFSPSSFTIKTHISGAVSQPSRDFRTSQRPPESGENRLGEAGPLVPFLAFQGQDRCA